MPRSSPLSNQGGAWQTLRSDRGQQFTLRHARKSRPDRGTSVRPAQPAAGADRAATLWCVDERDRKAVHERWAQRQNRRPDTLGYREEWYFQQCGGCLHWLALAGKLGDDWASAPQPRRPMTALRASNTTAAISSRKTSKGSGSHGLAVVGEYRALPTCCPDAACQRIGVRSAPRKVSSVGEMDPVASTHTARGRLRRSGAMV